MNNVALGIEYQGTNYCGWQFQPHCIAVQQKLQVALSSVANQKIDVFCAGRTDTGVHAIGQVVNFLTEVERPIRAWVEGVNTQLPNDIRVAWAQFQPNNFHARFSAIARQYRYVIFNRKVHSAILADRVSWVHQRLDETKMCHAAQALVGEHDFSSFRAAGCQAEHARRNVHSVSVTRRGNFVLIDIEANAFLHHMVRNIVGTLIDVGLGRTSETEFKTLISLKDRSKAGVTAPASGLYFVNAIYPEVDQIPNVSLDEVLWEVSE